MTKSQTTPNVIVFFTDQQRWDTVGCYGNPNEVTPNLDRMAEEGVRFEHAFTCQPVCGPARACIQTGRYATETGCFRNLIALPSEEKTIAHRFSDAGYETGYIGKWHLASTIYVPGHADENYSAQPVPPELRGGYKDYWLAADALESTSHGYEGHLYNADMEKVEFRGYRADCLTDFAVDYLRTRDREKPFVFFLSYLEPHHQNDLNRVEGPSWSRERFGQFDVPGDLQGTVGDWRENYPDYLGACASLDSNLGRIRRELEDLGIAEDTLLVYTSDHGCHFRTRNEEYKRSCHEASIRVPLVVYGPCFTGGKVIDQLVSLIDIPPTLLTAACVESPQTMHGKPLQGLVKGSVRDWPQEVFVQVSEDHTGRAIRTKRWKYSIWVPSDSPWSGLANPGSLSYTEQCLYDLDNDPYERNNLVRNPEYADVRAELAGILKRRMLEAGEDEPEILAAD